MLQQQLAKFEDSAIDVIGVFGPWLGPIPSAYLVYGATIHYLGWWWPVALAAALAVESIGVVSIVVALRLYEWNQAKLKTEPAAPFALAVVLVGAYFAVTICLTVFLDVLPELARFAPAIFPMLAAVGAVNISLKNGQRRREAARAGRKAEKKALRRDTVERDRALAALAQTEAARDSAVGERDELAAQHATRVGERDTALAQYAALVGERDAALSERDALRQQIATGMVDLGRLPPRLSDYVTQVASGATPNGEFTETHGVGVSTLERTNRMFLNH